MLTFPLCRYVTNFCVLDQLITLQFESCASYSIGTGNKAAMNKAVLIPYNYAYLRRILLHSSRHLSTSTQLQKGVNASMSITCTTIIYYSVICSRILFPSRSSNYNDNANFRCIIVFYRRNLRSRSFLPLAMMLSPNQATKKVTFVQPRLILLCFASRNT